MVLALCTGVFGLIGFSGRKGRELELRRLMDELAPAYGEAPWFLVQHAFAQVETGDTELARKTIERAMALDPKSAHGAHVKAHVHYEAGEKERGLKYLQQWLPGYAKDGLLHCHINWHVALWQMELGDAEEAMRTYLRGVHPGGAWGPPINVLTDSAAFLWRAELAGRPRDAERSNRLHRCRCRSGDAKQRNAKDEPPFTPDAIGHPTPEHRTDAHADEPGSHDGRKLRARHLPVEDQRGNCKTQNLAVEPVK